MGVMCADVQQVMRLDMKKIMMAVAALAAFVATEASAVVLANVDGQQGLIQSVRANRDNPLNAITDDGTFFSLGFGGVFQVELTKTVPNGKIRFFETTTRCDGDASTCTNHPESVEVFTSTFMNADLDDTTGYTSLGVFGNNDAQPEASIDVLQPFKFVTFIDVSDPASTSFDGFDLNFVEITPIPLPMSAWMLLGGLTGVGLLRARRTKAV